VIAPALLYVCDGQHCIGFILVRGKLGFEGFDREEISLGIFKTQAAAADAVFGAAANERGAG
jgi:hypothetical protein